VSGELVAALVGLALLDSVNTSTVFLVMVIVLAARRPGQTAAAYALGAALSFLGLSLGLYLGAAAAEEVISDLARWLRRATFALLALWFLHLAAKRLRTRPSRPLLLPPWFGPLTAFPVGVAATAADLPNAFPLFIAIERLLSAQVGSRVAVLALVGYVVVYAVPIAVVLVLGVRRGPQARLRMQRITDRFLSGTAQRSIPLVALFTLAAISAATVVVVV
jgi:cytochrome c biogenesis protein CcdA